MFLSDKWWSVLNLVKLKIKKYFSVYINFKTESPNPFKNIMNIVYWFVHHLKYDVPSYFLKIVYMILATGGHYCPMGKTKKVLWSMMSSLGSDTQIAVTSWVRGGEGLHEPLVRVWGSGSNWVGKASVHNTFLSIADVSLTKDHTWKTSIF